MPENSYGPILGRIRRAREIKSALLAKSVKMSPTTYSQIELGHRSARFEDMCGICNRLGITVGKLEELMKAQEMKEGNNDEKREA